MASPSEYKDNNYKVEYIKFFLDLARQKMHNYYYYYFTPVKVEVKSFYMWPCLHLLSNGLFCSFSINFTERLF